MKKQVCVIGAGRFGAAMAEELYQSGHDVLAIDHDDAKVPRLAWPGDLRRKGRCNE